MFGKKCPVCGAKLFKVFAGWVEIDMYDKKGRYKGTKTIATYDWCCPNCG